MPIWVGARGIESVAAGDGVIKVVIGRAESPVGNPVGYRLYYADHPFEELNGISYLEVERPVIYLGRDPELPLVNGRTYYLLVVAYDKRFPERMTTNRELTTATPSDRVETDLDPPRFEGSSVVEVVAGRGAVRLEPGNAVDEGSGVGKFRVYFQPGEKLVPLTAQVMEFDPDEPIIVDHLTNGQTYTFLLTALDRASPPNESTNRDTVSATPSLKLPPLTPPRWLNPLLSGTRAMAPLDGGITVWAYPGRPAELAAEGRVDYLLEYRREGDERWERLVFPTPDRLTLRGKGGDVFELRLRLRDRYGNLSAPVHLGRIKLREKVPRLVAYSFPDGSELRISPGDRVGEVKLKLPEPEPPPLRQGATADGFDLVVYALPEGSAPPLVEPRLYRFSAKQLAKFTGQGEISLKVGGLRPGRTYRFKAELISLFPKLSASLPSGELSAAFKLPLPVGEEGYLEGFSPPPRPSQED